jgi:predicted RNA-binding protein with PUA domain
MTGRICKCGGGEKGEVCPLCGGEATLPYWCETCNREVADKRCPLCGLKAKKRMT